MGRYTEAITKLREMADFNEKFCGQIESGEFKIEGPRKDDEIKHLISTYRYWYQCCLMAAWLLDKEDESA
jgi:hypothetical protein